VISRNCSQPRHLWALAGLLTLGLLLRVAYLGNVFQSSDNAALASRIVSNPGYGWMGREYFGVMINFLIKLWAATLGMMGITLTEFCWKLPIAIVGSFQAPLLYFFLTSLGCSQFATLSGAAMATVLPIHIMWSRFPWGYEVLGVFFCTLAVWALLRFWQTPGRKSGFLASLAVGLYLISHGFIIPFFPSFIFAIWLLAPDKKGPLFARIGSGLAQLWKNHVWLFPMLFSPLIVSPIAHSLKKKSRLGFYLDDHFIELLGDLGIALLSLLLLAVIAYWVAPKVRSYPITTLLGFFACAYLAPLWFGTPPGITIVGAYLLMGIYFWMIFAIFVLDKLLSNKKSGRWLWSICLVFTLAGAINHLFRPGQVHDLSLIKMTVGNRDADPGSKAAGYLVQKHLSRDATLLVLHRHIEPPNLLYYFRRRGISFFDLSLAQSRKAYLTYREQADVLIADGEQAPWISIDPRFVLRVLLYAEKYPCLWLFCRKEIYFPELKSDTKVWNRLFDRDFSWKVSFF
jgi:hypothetical protein